MATPITQDIELKEGEKISITKAVKAPFTGIYWVKVIMLGFGMFVIFTLFTAVKDKFFGKPSQEITVKEGGKVDIHNESKKNFYIFTEPYIGVDSNNKGSVGIRVGIRWEF